MIGLFYVLGLKPRRVTTILYWGSGNCDTLQDFFMNNEVKCNYAGCKDYYYDGEYICLNPMCYSSSEDQLNMKQCKKGCEHEELPMVPSGDTVQS